jgi:two-component system phosphate regulon sensor histidine kinase PhoR
MADIIYKKQMDAVLFSLNQYTDDLMEQWVRKLANNQYSITRNSSDLILGNEAIQMLVLHQMETQKDSIFINDYVTIEASTNQHVKNWFIKKDILLTQLTSYLSAGFQKIQSADDWIPIQGMNSSQSGMSVMVYDSDSVLYNALFIFETNLWVEQLLGSKMQAIAQDDFTLAVLQENEVTDALNIIYNTKPSFYIERDYVQKPLWILSDTYLAIQAKGESYSELIRKRSQTNLYFLFFSVLIVLIGAFIIFRNIRNTLKIAQLKSDFVSNVSHEIRTPLSLIRMYAETLMLGRLPSEDKKQHYYQVIHHESGRLSHLVNNILDFSKIEANRKTYQLVNKDMNELVEQLYSDYSYSFKEKEVDCQLQLAPNSIPISVDVQAFEEALSNVIENAVKYSDKTRSITISTSIEKGHGCCQVADQGVGISKAEQKNIFEKFYRVESALTQKTKGTGLGLSLVKHIMESHKGTIEVTSEVNNGSTFALNFPLTKVLT